MNYSIRGIIIILFFSIFILFAYIIFTSNFNIKQFIIQSKTHWIYAGIVFCVIALSSIKLYQQSLDDFDQETSKTDRISLINVVVWLSLWISWGILNGLLYNEYDPKSSFLFLFSVLVTIIPAIGVFLFTYSVRKNHKKDALTDSSTHLRSVLLYSGLYSIFSLPSYCITLLF